MITTLIVCLSLLLIVIQIIDLKHGFANKSYHMFLNIIAQFKCLNEQEVTICFTQRNANHDHTPLTSSNCQQCFHISLFVAIQIPIHLGLLKLKFFNHKILCINFFFSQNNNT